ncbi:MAG: ribbon-helix-helix protein, CopG family [Candidatus Altiarchaeales archaeon]|nr:ribbon-helix-helix protein, CopG family [Candidatus Altiarchaeales archaeon]
METIQIRLPEKEIKDMDKRVREGEYPSRSEAIRDMIRRAELFGIMSGFMELVKEEGISREEIGKGDIRGEVHREIFGG